MKKTVFFVLLLFTTVQVLAQKSNVRTASSSLNVGKLDKAKEAIDQAVEHEETNEWDKTYFIRGQLYQQMYVHPLETYRKLDPNAPIKAYNAYMKAIELSKLPKNQKGLFDKDYRKSILDELPNLKNILIKYGADQYDSSDYKTAYKAFDKALHIDTFPEIATTDTALIFNAAIAAYNAKMWEEAIQYFNKTKELNYGGAKIYLYTAIAYKELEKNEEYIEELNAGIEAYPDDNQALITELINFFLTNENTNEALKFLNMAIEKDPENYSYHFAKGTLYDKKYVSEMTQVDTLLEEIKRVEKQISKLKLEKVRARSRSARNEKQEEIDKKQELIEKKQEKIEKHKKVADEKLDDAISSYKKSLEIKPDYLNSNYNLGAIYFNQALRILNQAGDIPLDEKDRYDKEVEKAHDKLKQALPYMEAAHKADPKEMTVLQTLATIYLRLQMYDKHKAIKAEIEELKEK